MSGQHWLASPLTGTFGVLVGLGILAVPLHRLTSVESVRVMQAPVAVERPAGIPAVLRLRLLAPVEHLVLTTGVGGMLLDQAELAAGETEYDVVLPLRDDELEIHLTADLGRDETAVFLTILPDGREERTCYVIGRGGVEDLLRYDWHTH